MSAILLLDLDHTLYPSTAPTLGAVDARITHFIETRLNLPADRADAMRRELCAEHGTTLRGLEILHGVSRAEYTDFIQDLADHLMPSPDARMRAWLLAAAARQPAYLFTNARRDWADRCLRHLGVADLLVATKETQASLRGILDIDFMEWAGKPHRTAFEKVEQFLSETHPSHPERVFADDRLDNLAAARAWGWHTIWVRPHDALRGLGAGHRIVESLLELDPETLE
jgi:putative hydrolase of the HAD superfamily